MIENAMVNMAPKKDTDLKTLLEFTLPGSYLMSKQKHFKWEIKCKLVLSTR